MNKDLKDFAPRVKSTQCRGPVGGLGSNSFVEALRVTCVVPRFVLALCIGVDFTYRQEHIDPIYFTAYSLMQLSFCVNLGNGQSLHLQRVFLTHYVEMCYL